MDTPENFDQPIFSEKLTALYSSNLLSTVGTLTVGLVYVGIQLPYHKHSTLALWFSALVAIYLYRFFLTKKYFQIKPPPEKQLFWLQQIRLVVLLTGITLGSTVVFFYPHDDIPRQMFTVLLLAGMAAGGLTVHVSDLVLFTGYILSLLLPLIFSSLITPDRFYLFVAALLVIYLIIMLRASRRLNDIVTSSLQLRYENLNLVNDLEREKNQLNNRLGRILNDSSNELYIADAATLSLMQVNKGALQNLGYTENEISGMKVPDVIVDLSREQLFKLVEPLCTKSSKESVTYKTLHKRKNGTYYPVELNFQLSSQENPPVLVITALDITERDEAERKLIHQANFDQLTDLPNRYYMLSYIESAFARARRQRAKVALLFMDLDNFKDINDTLGHGVGDELLKQVADRIRSLLREADMAARLGGDEFLVMLEGLQRQEQAEIIVNKIVRSFNRPFHVNSSEIYTSASIGISTYPDDGQSVEVIMQNADSAMYYAKQERAWKYVFFSHEIRAYIDEQLTIEKHLRHAIKREELSVYFQPKINTHSGQIVGAEALVRWNNPELGPVPPSIFIPVAEKYGLIEEIGSWVLKAACLEARTWKDLSFSPMHVAVNISPRQFRSNNFISVVENVLNESGLPPHLLEIEITESLLMQDTDEPLEILNALRKKNITLSLDDFGTGYSSLSYLKRFPLQVLKIDRSFINDMMKNHYNMSLVDAIIAMAKILNLHLVAEGVETQEQLGFLRRRKVETVQGFLFSPPISSSDFRSYLSKAAA